jgi:hypothetical protein
MRMKYSSLPLGSPLLFSKVTKSFLKPPPVTAVPTTLSGNTGSSLPLHDRQFEAQFSILKTLK